MRLPGCVASAPVDNAISDNASQDDNGDDIEHGIAGERQPCHLHAGRQRHCLRLNSACSTNPVHANFLSASRLVTITQHKRCASPSGPGPRTGMRRR